jgi:ribonuclease E
MTRHAYPTLPDERSRALRPSAEARDLGEWDEAVDFEAASDAGPALAEAEHQVLADDDLDDDDDVEDLDEEDDADDPDEDDEKSEDDEDEDDDFDDEDDEDDEDDDGDEDEK